MLSQSYANEQELKVGDTVKVADRKLDVVGISGGTVGGQSSSVYMELGALQKLADLDGRVNAVEVQATDSTVVDSVAERIEASFNDSEVTTASDLADQVSGSLVDAKNLSGKLGTALAVVALLGAFGIASLVTLSSVNKRTRELGTLKALGWRQSLVVRQVAGESVVQGLIGGVAGAVLGIGAAAAIGAAGISLDASLATGAAVSGFPGGPGGRWGTARIRPGGRGGGKHRFARRPGEPRRDRARDRAGGARRARRRHRRRDAHRAPAAVGGPAERRVARRAGATPIHFRNERRRRPCK